MHHAIRGCIQRIYSKQHTDQIGETFLSNSKMKYLSVRDVVPRYRGKTFLLTIGSLSLFFFPFLSLLLFVLRSVQWKKGLILNFYIFYLLLNSVWYNLNNICLMYQSLIDSQVYKAWVDLNVHAGRIQEPRLSCFVESKLESDLLE